MIGTAVAIHALTIAATLATRRRAALCRWTAFAGAAAAGVFTIATGLAGLRAGAPLAGTLFRHTASGITLDYLVDPLAAWFLLVLGLLTVPIALYSAGYTAHAVPRARMATLGVAFNVLLAAVAIVFVASTVIGFLFAWELMTLATTTLVATEHESRASRRAAYLYLMMSHVGTGALVAGFFTLAAAAGSMAFPALLGGGVVSGPLRDVVFVLFFLGFGVKAGIIPLHVWLPEAHPAAPSNVSALMSAVLITAGIYGLFRICAFGLGTPDVNWGLACMAVGAITAILGVLYALTQNDLKRLLAYSTIDNAGIAVLGLGVAMTAAATRRSELAVVAVAASLYHVLNHAAFKGLLFLGAGSVVMATGTRQIEELGGLMRRMPWTGLFFLVGAVSISAMPPLNGFASEWLTFVALLLGFQSLPGVMRVSFPLTGALLALTSALAAACFVKAFGISFLALPRSENAERAHEVPLVMLAPQGLLALLCLALGLFPGVVLTALSRVAASLPTIDASPAMARGALAMAAGTLPFAEVTPAALAASVAGGVLVALAVTAALRAREIRRVATWGCGGVLTPSSEYTATAFSKPLLMIFRAVYRPTREVEALAGVSPYFPQEVRYRVAIALPFERYVYAPLVRGVMAVAERMRLLQAGSLHAYLGYVLVLGLVLLLWLGGNR